MLYVIDAVLNPGAGEVLPDPATGTQALGFAVTGTRTATGTEADVPFTSDFPRRRGVLLVLMLVGITGEGRRLRLRVGVW